MAWIWATPIMYETDSVPVAVVMLLNLNPMTLIIKAYHDILYYHQLPGAEMLLICLLEGVIFLLIGEMVFHHLEGNFVEEL